VVRHAATPTCSAANRETTLTNQPRFPAGARRESIKPAYSR